MEIKRFKLISTWQRKELYNFIKSMDLTYNKTYIEMIKIYESDTFEEGNNIFILFDEGQIKGSIGVITKEISIKGEAYITDIYVENVEITICFLIKKAVEYCDICSGSSIKIGIRACETHLIPYINKLGFSHIYDAVVMRFTKGKDMILDVKNEIKLIALSTLNSREYMNIQNEAFKNSPNGETVDEVDVKDYIVQYANNEDLIGLCFTQKKSFGIFELSIVQNIGWIDIIGIKPIYQNKGFGKGLLVKCIKKLYKKNLNIIKLLVITSNNIALNMYKKIGFEEEKVFSYWFEKKI